jgi:hypothetical protein
MNTLAELQVERAALLDQRAELDFEMKRLAHQGRVLQDRESRLALAELRERAVRLDQRLREIEIAIEQTKERAA